MTEFLNEETQDHDQIPLNSRNQEFWHLPRLGFSSWFEILLGTISSSTLGNLFVRFFNLTFVNVFSNIVIPLAGLVDSAFLGHLSNLRYLAGVALATVLFNLLYGTLKVFRWATTGPTAQAVGADDPDEVLLTLLRNGLIALVMGLVLLMAQSFIRDVGFLFLDADPGVKTAAIDYFNSRIWSAPAVLVNFVLLGWFMGREQGKILLLLSIVGSASNIFLDYVFIIQWGWQSAGAGVATALSQYLMLLVGLILFFVEGWWDQILATGRSIFTWKRIQETISVSGDLFIARLSWVVTVSAFTTVSSHLGVLTLSANTLLLGVIFIAADFLDGISFSTETLAGYFIGAGDRPQLIPLLKIASATGLIIALSFTSVLMLFPDSIFSLLTNHADVIDKIHAYLLWIMPILAIWALTLVLHGYFLGLTESRLIRNSIVSATLLGFTPLAWVAWTVENNQLIWFALLLYLLIRMIALFVKLPISFEPEITQP